MNVIRSATLLVAIAAVAHMSGCIFGEGPKGLVLNPSGEPAAGAQVILAAPTHPVTLENGKLSGYSKLAITTEVDGSFDMQWILQPYLLVAASEAGIAVVRQTDFTDGDQVQLQAYGTVAGAMPRQAPGITRITAEPLPVGDWLPEFQFAITCTTDESGTFSLPGVPPGLVLLKESPDKKYASPIRTIPIEVKPGGTTALTDNGLTVGGRILLPTEADRDAFNRCRGTFELQGHMEPPPPPDNLPEPAQKIWLRQWEQSEEGAAVRIHNFRRYDLQPDDDGRYLVENVAPGRYRMTGLLRNRDRVQVGSLSELVEIAVAGGSTAVALEDKTVVAQVVFERGDAAPAFTVESLDGGEITLAQYRGKYVLLTFWESSSTACREEIPYLKKAFEAFKSHDNFAMLSLNLDADIETARAYVEEHGISWPQGSLGNSTLPDQYGVTDIPATFLVDPEGDFSKFDLRGPSMTDEVKRYLAG